jgi:DNA polymerase-3 subunit chi
MSEALFYHLEHFPLERVLPNLIEKSLERNWRVIVRSGSQERLDALDLHLWTYRDNSFLPHGTARESSPYAQPVYLTLGDDNPNGANVLFLVDGADFSAPADYERIVYLFDGRDEDALSQARGSWKTAKAAGIPTTYWQQEQGGRWVKRA